MKSPRPLVLTWLALQVAKLQRKDALQRCFPVCEQSAVQQIFHIFSVGGALSSNSLELNLCTAPEGIFEPLSAVA